MSCPNMCQFFRRWTARRLVRLGAAGSLVISILCAAAFDPAPILKRAKELEAAGNYAAAIAEYDKVVQALPRDSASLVLRGWAKHLARDEQGAIVDLGVALNQNPNDLVARNRRGLVHKALQHWEEAAEDFAGLTQRAPDNARAHRELAYCLMSGGKLAEALPVIDKAVTLEPANAEFHSLRSAIHDKLGDPVRALADMERALKLNKDEKLAAAFTKARDRYAAKVAAAPVAVKAAPVATNAPAAPVAMATTEPAEAGPGPLNINQLSAGQYNGAVSVAMEGLRLVLAPLSADDTARFEKKWVPMFSYATAESVAYLNKLNPLVQEFLLLRSQIAAAAAAYDKALEEVRFAAAYESKDGTRTALAEVKNCLELLRDQQAHLTELNTKIQQLGDPPDVGATHRKRQAAHAAAIKTVKHAAGLPTEKFYAKFGFYRQPEGWSHSLVKVGTEESWANVPETLLPTDERHAFLIPNDVRIATMSRLYRDKDPRTYVFTDDYGAVEFYYHGSDLIGLGSLTVRVSFVHARLDRPEDLGLSRPVSSLEQRSFGATSAAGCPGQFMSIDRDGARDEPWEPKFTLSQLIALDPGQGAEDYQVMISVESNCESPAVSENLPAERKLWAERSALLRARIASRVQALLNSFDFDMVPAIPKIESQRAKALQEFANANPLRRLPPEDYLKLCDAERGHWALRPGADPVPSLDQNIQSGNSGQSIFDKGKTVFRHTWTRPPAKLTPDTQIEIALASENTVQNFWFNKANGKTYIMDESAFVEANWSALAARNPGADLGKLRTEAAHADPAKGQRRTEARANLPVGRSFGSSRSDFTKKVWINFTHGGAVEYVYDWEWELGGDNAAIPTGMLPFNMSGEPVVPPPSAEEIANAEADKKWRQERISEIRENMKFLHQALAREEQELSRENDLTRKGSLQFRVLGLRSDIQAEEDLITSLQTGEIVHTRSPFDQYAGAQFVQQCETEAREATQMVRAVNAANRLAAMLPPGEADKTREFIRRQLTPKVVGTHDVKTARQVLQALGNSVQGHFEGIAAQGASEAALAQLGMDAASNIKSAADTGMSALSMVGGQSINLIYLAGTGYVEGGPLQALKAAGSAWSNKIDYAVTAYDTYQKQGADAAVDAIMWKVGQDIAMDYIAGKFAGPEIADPNSNVRKPTLQEQFDAAKFNQEREWGEALVKDFHRTQTELLKAGGAGAAPDVLMKLQASARDKAAAVASSLHAKNFLKYKADPAIGKAYDTHMRAIHAEADAILMDGLAQRKWNADEIELMDFRNSASFGKPNFDRDLGIRERSPWQLDDRGLPLKGADGHLVRNPDAWTTGPNGAPVPKPQLTKDGKPMTLDQWREEAQELYNQAYRKASGGRSAAIAMEGITTSTHPEAYKDLMWLGQDKTLVSGAWAGQAGDVTRYKAQHILNHGDPSASYFTKLQEVARGSAKDMETKLIPLLDRTRPQGAGIMSEAVSSVALADAREHWGEVHRVLQAFGRNDLDPITATRRIRELTGGKSIPEVVDGMATLLESLAKFGRR